MLNDPLTRRDGVSPHGSSASEYLARTIGQGDLLRLLKYELWMMFLADLNGAAGYFLRRVFQKMIFTRRASKLILSPGVRFRGIDRIRIGDAVRIDEGACLDCYPQAEGIEVGHNCLLERNVTLSTGPLPASIIKLGQFVSIGVGSVLVAHTKIVIGNNVMIGPLSYITAGEHVTDLIDIPICKQGHRGQGVSIGNDVWIGTGVTILDGVTIGDGAIVGAGAVVTGPIDPYAIVVGVPARLLRFRSHKD